MHSREKEIRRAATEIVSFKPWLRSDSNYVVFGGKASVYALIPADIREELKKVGIDITKKNANNLIKVDCCLVTGESDGRPRLIFEFIPSKTAAIITEMEKRR